MVSKKLETKPVARKLLLLNGVPYEALIQKNKNFYYLEGLVRIVQVRHFKRDFNQLADAAANMGTILEPTTLETGHVVIE